MTNMVIGTPLPYGTKVAARYIARVNASPNRFQPSVGLTNAMNHLVAGYMSSVGRDNVSNIEAG